MNTHVDTPGLQRAHIVLPVVGVSLRPKGKHHVSATWRIYSNTYISKSQPANCTEQQVKKATTAILRAYSKVRKRSSQSDWATLCYGETQKRMRPFWTKGHYQCGWSWTEAS